MVKKAGVGVLHTGILQHVSIRVFHCALNTEVGTQHNSGVSLDFFADPQKSKRTLSFYFANPRLLHIITPHRTGSNILLIDTYTNWLVFFPFTEVCSDTVSNSLRVLKTHRQTREQGSYLGITKCLIWKNRKRRCHSVSKDFQTIVVLFSFLGKVGFALKWHFISWRAGLCMQHLDAWHPFVLIHLFLRHGLEHDISTMIRDV